MDTRIKHDNRKRDMLVKRKATQKTTEFKQGQKALNYALRNEGVDGFIASQEKYRKKEAAQEMASSESQVMSSMLSGLDLPTVVKHVAGRTTRTIYNGVEIIAQVFLDGELISQEITKT